MEHKSIVTMVWSPEADMCRTQFLIGNEMTLSISFLHLSWSKIGPSNMTHLVEHEDFHFFFHFCKDTIEKPRIMTVCVCSVMSDCNRVDCSLLGSSVCGVLLARILECIAISFSRGSSWTRDWTCVSCPSRWILYHRTTWEVQGSWSHRHCRGCNRQSGCCVWFLAYVFLMLKCKNIWRSKKCLNRKETLRRWLWCDHK